MRMLFLAFVIWLLISIFMNADGSDDEKKDD